MASSLQPARGREGRLSGATLCSIPTAQRPLRRSSGSCLLSAWFGSLEAHIPPGLLRAPLSITPGHLLPHLPLTERYALVEPADPPLHFHTHKPDMFTPKSRARALVPSPSAALLAHLGTPSLAPWSSCSAMGSGWAPREPKGSAPPRKHSWPSPATQGTRPQSFAPPEMTRVPRTETRGRMLQTRSDAGQRKTHIGAASLLYRVFSSENSLPPSVFPQDFSFSLIPSCLEAQRLPRFSLSCIRSLPNNPLPLPAASSKATGSF